MAVHNKNRFRKKTSGARVAALAVIIVILVACAGYFLLSPSKKTIESAHKTEPVHVKPVQPALSSLPHTTVPPIIPALPSKEKNKYPTETILPETEKPDRAGGAPARLAIIIDDMGSSMSEARSLSAIKVPLTFAIIPGLRADKDVAAYAAAHTIETMIHIPMQSQGWPARHLETNGLLVSMEADELEERVSGFVQNFPGAIGANNHMGSEFTEHEDKMTSVLQVLKKNNLFFIDSVTSPASTGLKVAKRLGIRSARRNVFLDNEQERGYILGQLNQAVRLAKKTGSAIAICHPHPATISALAAALPGLAGKRVVLVPASQLVN